MRNEKDVDVNSKKRTNTNTISLIFFFFKKVKLRLGIQMLLKLEFTHFFSFKHAILFFFVSIKKKTGTFNGKNSSGVHEVSVINCDTKIRCGLLRNAGQTGQYCFTAKDHSMNLIFNKDGCFIHAWRGETRWNCLKLLRHAVSFRREWRGKVGCRQGTLLLQWFVAARSGN